MSTRVTSSLCGLLAEMHSPVAVVASGSCGHSGMFWWRPTRAGITACCGGGRAARAGILACCGGVGLVRTSRRVLRLRPVRCGCCGVLLLYPVYVRAVLSGAGHQDKRPKAYHLALPQAGPVIFRYAQAGRRRREALWWQRWHPRGAGCGLRAYLYHVSYSPAHPTCSRLEFGVWPHALATGPNSPAGVHLFKHTSLTPINKSLTGIQVEPGELRARSESSLRVRSDATRNAFARARPGGGSSSYI
jgi:hypothetical protein